MHVHTHKYNILQRCTEYIQSITNLPQKPNAYMYILTNTTFYKGARNTFSQSQTYIKSLMHVHTHKHNILQRCTEYIQPITNLHKKPNACTYSQIQQSAKAPRIHSVNNKLIESLMHTCTYSQQSTKVHRIHSVSHKLQHDQYMHNIYFCNIFYFIYA